MIHDDAINSAALELTAALSHADRIAQTRETEVTYETMQRSGFRRADGYRRKYALGDARSDARNAATRLRLAWELLDPVSKESQAEAKRTALGNAQEALKTAVDHLQAVLNKCRTAAEQETADTAARDWLTSIGSEPR